jgi:hypothetical protein
MSTNCDPTKIADNTRSIATLRQCLEDIKKDLKTKTEGEAFVEAQSIVTAQNITSLNETIEGKAIEYLQIEEIQFDEQNKETYEKILAILPEKDLIKIKYNNINNLIIHKKKTRNNIKMFGEKRLANDLVEIAKCVEELKESKTKIEEAKTILSDTDVLNSYNSIETTIEQYLEYSNIALEITRYLNETKFPIPTGMESQGETEKAHPITSSINAYLTKLKDKSGTPTEKLPELESISKLNTNFKNLENAFELDHSVHYSVFKEALEKIQSSYGEGSEQLSLYTPYISILEKLENSRCLYVENIYTTEEGQSTDQPEYCTPEIVKNTGNVAESGADGGIDRKYLKSDIDAKIDRINEVILEAKAAPYNMYDKQLKDFIEEKKTLEGIKDANQQIIQENLAKGGKNWIERQNKLKDITDKYVNAETRLNEDTLENEKEEATISFQMQNRQNVIFQNNAEKEFISAIKSKLTGGDLTAAEELYKKIAGDDGKLDENEYQKELDDKLDSMIRDLPENQVPDEALMKPKMRERLLKTQQERVKDSIASARIDLRSKFDVLKRYNDKIAKCEEEKNAAISEAETSCQESSAQLVVVQATTIREALNNFDTDNYNKYLELIECTTRDNINNQTVINQQIIDNLIDFGTKTEQDSINKAIKSISEKMEIVKKKIEEDDENDEDVVTEYKNAYKDINSYMNSIQQQNYDAALNPEIYVCNTLENEDKVAKTASRLDTATTTGAGAGAEGGPPPPPTTEEETAAGKRKTSLKINVQKKSLRRNKQIHSKLRKTKKNRVQRKSISRKR